MNIKNPFAWWWEIATVAGVAFLLNLIGIFPILTGAVALASGALWLLTFPVWLAFEVRRRIAIRAVKARKAKRPPLRPTC